MATSRNNKPQEEPKGSAAPNLTPAERLSVGESLAIGDQAANADEARAMPDDAPSWAVDDDVEIPEVDPRYRREQLDRLRRDGGGTEASRGVVVVGPRTAELTAMLRQKAAEVIDTSANAIEDIVGRIMDATTVDQVLADDELPDAEELLNVPLQIWSIKVNESDFTDGMQFYCIVNAVRQDTKEDVTFSCGAYKVCGQLVKLDRMNAFPVVAKLVKKAKATQSGYFPLALVAVR